MHDASFSLLLYPDGYGGAVARAKIERASHFAIIKKYNFINYLIKYMRMGPWLQHTLHALLYVRLLLGIVDVSRMEFSARQRLDGMAHDS